MFNYALLPQNTKATRQDVKRYKIATFILRLQAKQKYKAQTEKQKLG